MTWQSCFEAQPEQPLMASDTHDVAHTNTDAGDDHTGDDHTGDDRTDEDDRR